jgi:phosphoenolpyruvate carboxykinase (GTP)
MLPFCGYNMGEYFQHWVNIGANAKPGKLPKIFCVNWFRKTDEGKWLWPGYGENSRVLKWVFERCAGSIEAEKTAIGMMPRAADIDLTGLSDVTAADMKDLLTINRNEWEQEVVSIKEHFARFGATLPSELRDQLVALEQRLAAL